MVKEFNRYREDSDKSKNIGCATRDEDEDKPEDIKFVRVSNIQTIF